MLLSVAWRVRGVYVPALLILTILFLPGVQPAVSAEQGLAEIYRLAVENDPTLAGAQYLRAATRESLTQAWSEVRPTLDASFTYTDTTQEIISSDNTVYDQGKSDYGTEEYALTLRQPLLRIDTFMAVKRAKIEQVKADFDLEAINQELMVRVSERYLKALSAQDQLDFARAEEMAVRQHYELASGRFEMGLAPITDLHDARARLASREARTLEAEIAVGDALQALRELTGDIPEALQPLADGFEPIDPEPDAVEPWVEAALEQNLTVQSQRELVELARRTVKIQKAGHYPTLDLVGRFNNQTTDGTLFGGGSEVETTDITLQFSLPLYHGGATSSKSREANEQYNKARSDYEKALRETERLARSSFLGVKNSIARIAALKQALVAQQSTLEAKQEGYRSGLFTSLAVLDAERDLYMAMAEFAQSRYDYILNSLKLRQADGSLSESDLELASSWFATMPVDSGMTDEMKDEGTPN